MSRLNLLETYCISRNKGEGYIPEHLYVKLCFNHGKTGSWPRALVNPYKISTRLKEGYLSCLD